MQKRDAIYLIIIGILLGILLPFLKGSTTAVTKASPIPGANTGGDNMADHHASPAPADNSKFQALKDKEAPDFTMEDYNGKTVKLSDFRGKDVILFFSEGAMCYPSCWDQMAAFGEDKKFASRDLAALTIVVDSKKDWDAVIQKMPKVASAEVLFDSDRKVSGDYGVLTLASSMHRGQFPGHTYIIVDKKGIVRFLGDDPQMGVRNNDLLKEVGRVDRKYN